MPLTLYGPGVTGRVLGFLIPRRAAIWGSATLSADAIVPLRYQGATGVPSAYAVATGS